MNLSGKLSALGLLCVFAFSASAQSNKQIRRYFDQNRDQLGLSKEDCADFVIKNEHASKQFELTFAYAHQQYQGIPIHNAIANFVLTADSVQLTGLRWEKNLSARINTTNPEIDEIDAITAAAKELNIFESNELLISVLINDRGETVYSSDLISREVIPVTLCYAKSGNDLKLAWDLSIRSPKDSHWWSVRVDAVDGTILNQNDWMLTCSFGEEGCTDASHFNETVPQPQSNLMMPPPPPSTDQYNVFVLPAESPNHAPASLAVGPSDPVASPYGWHDDDGASGAEYTITRGNNVYASEDTNDDDQPGYSPDGGVNLDFNFPVDLNQSATGFWDPAITNLFYMNNMMHDVWYHYGFDEAGGNFQENNYGNGGIESDYVNADAQDGSGTNNANFGTPPDGGNPRMQMYIWTAGGTPKLLEINSPVGLAGQYIAQDATIGPGLPSTPITADLALFDDGTGDSADACEDAINGASLSGKIVVIRRGTCAFADKIVRAETEGAVAVIIVNNQGGLSQIGGTDPGIGIPSIMVTSATGEDLITELENGGTINGSVGYFGPFDRDSDLDNGIIAHEYGHGISNRLTGGASSADCLYNEEQMGEGWSDYFALIMTMKSGDQGTDARGIGTYANGEPTNGPGIRPAPYSTDFSVNGYTYASTNSTSLTQPHGIGFVWCTMLWDLTWAMIDQHGFDPDLHNGTGGNNMAMNLVMTGMKIQPCSPGFVDGRDAILAADQMLYGGSHECLIWEVFANRGLGYSADQGSSFDRADQTGAFDLPPGMDHETNATVSCSDYVWAVNGQTYSTSGTYYASITPTVGCDSIATLNLTINNSISSIVTYNGPTTLVSTVDNVNYQWLNCSQGDTPVAGATGQTFNPTENGLYAVVAYQGDCIDTSVCLFVNQVSISDLDLSNVQVYPNPTNGGITIDLGNTAFASIQARIVNAIGQTIHETSVEGASELHMDIKGAPGIYFVHLNADGKSTILKVIKE